MASRCAGGPRNRPARRINFIFSGKGHDKPAIAAYSSKSGPWRDLTPKMIVFCSTCGQEIDRSEGAGAFACERCGAQSEYQHEVPTFGDIAKALDEIERKLADLSQAIKF